MEQFTYTRTGAALRSKVMMMLVLLSTEIIFWLGISFLIRRPWNWVVLGSGLLLTAWAFWHLTGMLRKVHTLDDRALTLRYTRHTLILERGEISAVRVLNEPLPRGTDDASLSYRPEEDTLYILANRRGLVSLELSRPYEAKVPRRGLCQFTRVVLSLDEPERFVAALGRGGTAAVRVAPADAAAPAVGTPAVAPEAGSGPAAILLKGLVRRYGDFTAVGGIDLALAPGEVLAFLGSNGAGKSTTIRMMTGLLRPTAGQVLIQGRDLWAEGPEVRRLTGYVPDVPLLYESLTAREFLWLMAGLYGLPEGEGRSRADELLAQMKLERWGDQLIRSFSLGMKRKMAIAAALVHRPRILLLDEVTNGLDPRAGREVKDLIASAARSGAAVFLTTHLLDVAEELAHRIAVIHAGQIRAIGTLDELRLRAGLPGGAGSLEKVFLALTGPAEVSA